MLKEKNHFTGFFTVFSSFLSSKYTVGCLGRDLFENSFG